MCPEDAIVEGPKEIGVVRTGRSGDVRFGDGLVKTAVGGVSPRVIAELKKRHTEGVILLDSPPGTACATVESVKGADLCLLVADPTPFALHDLRLSVNMCRQIGLEPAVVVNRAGLDDTDLRDYCRRAELDIVGEIPDERRIAEVYSVGDMLVERLPEYRRYFEPILERTQALARESRPAKTHLLEPLFKTGGRSARAAKPNPEAPRPAEIVVISGKGGTGKTTLTACFAQLADKAVISDCDVDAADLHLLLDPEVREEGDFVGGVTVEINPEACTRCGKCAEHCRFDAIVPTEDGGYAVDPTACEGCGVCGIVCPADATRAHDAVNGRWFVSSTRFGPMSHAMLGLAEENSGRLVTLVRDLAVELAAEEPVAERAVIDGSPGMGCPVIASLSGAKYAVVVTEPTVSGLHDMERVLDLTRHFRVRTGVIVNKADLNADMASRIETTSREAGADDLGALPYDPAFTQAQLQRQTLLEAAEGPTAEQVRELWTRVLEAAGR